MTIQNKLVAKNKELNLDEIKSGKMILQSKPLFFNIDLTGRCNFNPPCVFCAAKSEGYHYNYQNISYLDRYAPFLSRCESVTDCSFGEALTHPDFFKIVQQVAGRGQLFVFSTNGLQLTQEKANLLVTHGKYISFVVSINASNPKTYYSLTGQDFNKLISNIRYFISRFQQEYPESSPPLFLSFIVMKCNRYEVLDFLELAHTLGVYGVCLRHLFDVQGEKERRNDFGHDFIYKEEILSHGEYETIGEKAKSLCKRLDLNVTINWETSKSELSNLSEPGMKIACLFPWKFLFVQEHSKNVYICCYSNIAIGQLNKQSLDEIWNGEETKKIRESLLDGRVPDFCFRSGTNCPLVLDIKHKQNTQ